MGRILALAEQRGLAVVEDAAHALPTTWRGRLIGTLNSAATVFSFYANKTMTTGEGGMIVTRDAALAQRVRVMRNHGIDRAAFDRFVSKKPSWYYEVVAPGFKYNLTDIAAAIGIVQLKKLPALAAARRRLAARYYSGLADLPLTLPADALPGDEHAWHLYVVRLSDEIRKSRDEVIAALAALGIGTSVHYVPLHRQPYWRDRYGLRAEMFPNAETAYRRMISIPLSAGMSDAVQERVIDALTIVLG
jgi:dTDP-4-amino-4,6-dideoxygalactose transaminase